MVDFEHFRRAVVTLVLAWLVCACSLSPRPSAVGSLSRAEDASATNVSTQAQVSASSALSAAASGSSLRQVAFLPPAPGRGQLIARDDVLVIDEFQVNELDQEVKVDSNGQISLALVGNITAAGRSIPQLEEEINQLYGERHLQSPKIKVSVKESLAQRVTVDGEVRRAGIFPVGSQTTLLKMIALSGGFSPVGDPSKIFVYRKIADDVLVAKYDVTAIRKGKVSDPAIFGGDVIVVFKSSSKVALEGLKEALGVASRGASTAIAF